MTNEDKETQLYQMNPTRRYSGVADIYASCRPNYPEEAFPTILAALGKPSELIAADIGGGTGISSRQLASHGPKVLVVEPNLEMRQAAATHLQVEWCEGVAENTGLPDSSVDLVTCFQAFHWFDPEPTLLEFSRILKPGGRVAAVWNRRNLDDRFTKEYDELLRVASSNHPARECDTNKMVNPLRNSQHFRNFRYHSFPHGQNQDLPGLIGLADSYSYVPEGPVQEQLAVDLGQLYQQWADSQGWVHLVYRTDVYLADFE